MRVSSFLSATALVSTILFAAPAWSQTTPDTATPRGELTDCPDTDANGECDPTASRNADSETITVTGSRIRLPAALNLEPTVRIDSAYIEQRNLTNVADALNEIPGFRGSVTPNGAQGSFGQGVNFINSFGLGSNRTLTLLNGRRVVSSNVVTIFGNASAGTQVDLNIIPTILVDYVDRVSIGGAPTYGSDAIAGTVNIVLKERFNGIEGRVTSGITDRGDNFRVNTSIAVGTDFAEGRGNITLAASYDESKGLIYNDRGFFRTNASNLTNPTSAAAATLGPLGRTPLNDGRINPNIGFNNSTTDGFPGSVLVGNVTIPSLTPGGLVVNNGGALRALDYNVQFDSAGNLVPFNRGILYNGAINSAAARASGGDGFRFNDYSQVTSDVKRISANLFVNYDLTDEVTLFGEGLYFRGRGDELVQQPTFNATLFGGASSALVFSATNPLLTSQAQALLASNGYTTFRLSRLNADLADPTGYSQNDLYRGVLGARSQFMIGERNFDAEIAVTYGRNDFVDFSQGINQQNFVNAVNVTRNTAGQIVCNPTPTLNATPGFTPTVDAACVPLNLFGQGTASQAALDYVLADVLANSRLQQLVINANFGGSPFAIFGNDVGLNLGFEHRQEEASFRPDDFQRQGLGRSVAILPNSGSYTLNEVFGEALIPLFTEQNDFIFHSAEVSAKGRYVDNTVNGGFFSWSAGGSFSPIKDITFRGNYTKSFRAPAITELFSPVTNTFTTVSDLCAPSTINSGPAPAIRARNCAAFLAQFPTATPLAASLATVPGRSGGNPNLDNEEANSFTFGVVMQPRFIPGLTLSVDYLDIELKKPISNLTVAQIVSACFDNPSFDLSDPANGNAFCSQIQRDPTGQVISDPANPGVSSGFVNGVSQTFEGIQGTLVYNTKLDRIGLPGSITTGGDLFFVRRRIVDTTGVAPARSDGVIGDPQFQGQARFRYNDDSWGFTTNVNYVGEQLFSRFNRGPEPSDIREFDELNDFVTIDSSIYFEIDKKMLFTLSVTNLTDRIGEDYYGIIAPSSISDLLGRRYAASVRVRY